MATNIAAIGQRPTGGGVLVPTNIDAVSSLTLPTTAQRGKGGVLSAYIQVEAQAARWSVNGTNPSAANGMLLAPTTATVQNTLIITGEEALSAFRIISATAGSLITYQFFKADNRS